MMHRPGDIGAPRSINCSEVIPRLFLGDIFTANKNTMTKMGVTHMITVEMKPIVPQDLAPCIKNYMFIKAMDHPKQDLISHFEASYKFIDLALSDTKNVVYTHCIAGISRSATLVIAYLMKSKSLTFQQAYDNVTKCRTVVHPNEGFLSQLRLYQKMNHVIDLTNMEYRIIVLEWLILEYRTSLSYYKSKPDAKEMLNDPGSRSEKFDINSLFEDYYNKLRMKDKNATSIYTNPYKCAKCRTHLFYSISVINPMRSSAPKETDLGKKDSLSECSKIFIEPQPWMASFIREKEGLIECGSCKTKLGRFDWSGGRKDCKVHDQLKDISIFKIDRKKVDKASESKT